MTTKCKDCKHWNVVRNARYGLCEQIKPYENGSRPLVYVKPDNLGEYGVFTRAEFGCIMWSKRT